MKIYKLVFSFLLVSLLFSASPVFAVTDLSAGNLIRSATFSFVLDMGQFAGLIFDGAKDKFASLKIIQDAKAGISKNSIILKQGLFTQSSRNFTAGLLDGFESMSGKIKLKLNGNQ